MLMIGNGVIITGSYVNGVQLVITSVIIVHHLQYKSYTTNKELLKVTDLLGRETKQTNQPLFYIYDDGTIEKKIIIE